LFGDEKMDVPIGGFIFSQSALLFCEYGLKYNMPWWVIWFPSLLVASILLLVLVIIIVIAIFDN
jgi:hypothetical protein